MNGEAHWIDPVVVLLGGVAILAMVWLASRGAVALTAVVRRIVCPARQAPVEVTAVRECGSGRWVDVRECTAFADPTDVRCDKACLATLRRAGEPAVEPRN